ncbi:acetyl-CoA carboxylase biotin carboxylase subunit [Myxococcota bacterium]|nr:acetyl-CoA carboxylase biotin carboxylase subunit [Myxococcota bacterium]
MFRRVLIANRGEVVVRVIRACRKLGIEVVAVHSEADRHAPYLAEVDEAVCIGPGPARDSYLRGEAILQAAEQTGCQAIHPGWGFLSENALFAERCRDRRIAFVGPSPGVMRLMGSKSPARAAAAAAGLPVIPGSDGVLPSVEAALEVALDVGYPVLLKADAGGGGRGMRVAREAGELRQAWELATAEAASAFGSGALYLEKLVEGGRHVEFQVLADAYGHAVHLFERDCSVQRNHQKLIEEAPSPALDRGRAAEMGARVARATAELGYVGAGTVEFLLDGGGELRFMEMNTRLQVEHPVTEVLTGIDLVEWQLRIAAGEPLGIRQEDVVPRGHAIECRINAEDPEEGFRPDPGEVARFAPPPPEIGGARIRVETHVRSGYRIPPYYDSMICKLIAHADTRDGAADGMIAALGELRTDGVRTTAPLHRAVLASPAFREGRYDTRSIPGWPAPVTTGAKA